MSVSSDSDRARKVFVVHGRNREARAAMFTFLRAIGLAPFKAARRAARAAATARSPSLPLTLPLRRRQRRSAGAKSMKSGPLKIQQVSSVRAGRPCSRCRDCPGPARTCPDQELAAIGSRDTSGQGPFTLKRQG
jgi:hypothetical protein